MRGLFSIVGATPGSIAESDDGARMSYKPFDVEALIDAVAPVMQLEIAPEHRPGVKLNLKTAAKMAALVEHVTLPDDTEPAPVYRP